MSAPLRLAIHAAQLSLVLQNIFSQPLKAFPALILRFNYKMFCTLTVLLSILNNKTYFGALLQK